MAELILKTDNLNQGREKLNAAIKDADTAKSISEKADTKAEQALANSESTQTQLNTIVIDGDSSVEAAQARVTADGQAYSTLKDRLDTEHTSLSTQLDKTDEQIIIMQTSKVYVETFPRLAVEMNDSARIGRAIEFAEPGAVIEFMPNKTYEITSVQVAKSITINLNGGFVKNIGNEKLFWLKENNSAVKNGFFTLTSATLAESMAIYAENIEGVTVENCTFDSSYYGIHLFNCKNVRIKNNVGNLSRHWDIYVAGGSDIIIQDNAVFNGEYDGIKVAGLQSNGVVTTSDVIIKNNVCNNNKRDGIDVALNEGNRILIDGNTLNNNYIKGIDLKTLAHENTEEIYYINGVLITNNIIQLPELTQSDGIAIQGRSVEQKVLDVSIAGNKIMTSTQPTSSQYGIALLRVTKATITDNLINGSTHGIIIGLSSNAKMRNNVIDVRLNCVITEVCQSAIVKLNDLTSETSSPVLVSQSVSNLEVGDNRMDYPRATRHSVSYLDATYGSLMLYNNVIDFRNVKPASRGTMGDVVMNTDMSVNKIEKWVCTTTSSAPEWRAVNLVV